MWANLSHLPSDLKSPIFNCCTRPALNPKEVLRLVLKAPDVLCLIACALPHLCLSLCPCSLLLSLSVQLAQISVACHSPALTRPSHPRSLKEHTNTCSLSLNSTVSFKAKISHPNTSNISSGIFLSSF